MNDAWNHMNLRNNSIQKFAQEKATTPAPVFVNGVEKVIEFYNKCLRFAQADPKAKLSDNGEKFVDNIEDYSETYAKFFEDLKGYYESGGNFNQEDEETVGQPAQISASSKFLSNIDKIIEALKKTYKLYNAALDQLDDANSLFLQGQNQAKWNQYADWITKTVLPTLRSIASELKTGSKAAPESSTAPGSKSTESPGESNTGEKTEKNQTSRTDKATETKRPGRSPDPATIGEPSKGSKITEQEGLIKRFLDSLSKADRKISSEINEADTQINNLKDPKFKITKEIVDGLIESVKDKYKKFYKTYALINTDDGSFKTKYKSFYDAIESDEEAKTDLEDAITSVSILLQDLKTIQDINIIKFDNALKTNILMGFTKYKTNLTNFQTALKDFSDSIKSLDPKSFESAPQSTLTLATKASTTSIEYRLNKLAQFIDSIHQNSGNSVQDIAQLYQSKYLDAMKQTKEFESLVRMASKKDKGVATKSNPSLWSRCKSEAKARMGGKHSARAMQLALKLYKQRGGKFKGKKPTAATNKMKKWTKQKWMYLSDFKKKKDKNDAKGRYLPKEKWENLSPSEREATNRKKMKEGKNKQYVANTEKAKVKSKAKYY